MVYVIGNKQIIVKTTTAQELLDLKNEFKLSSINAVITKLINEFKEVRK